MRKSKNSKSIPREWFFFNPLNNSNDKYFFKISNKIGVIFFMKRIKKRKNFLKKLNLI